MENSTILLVEDNADDELLTLRAFRKAKISNPIEVARDGVQALDYLLGDRQPTGGDRSGQPGVVLLDLKLPKIGGIEVLRRVRACERTKCIPIVVLTTSREDRDVVNAYQLGANSYIRKPVNYEQFVNAVQQIGQYWLVLNEPIPILDGV